MWNRRKTYKLAPTIKSVILLLSVVEYELWPKSHQTHWMQIICQIFWKFLINQIRIFNFTFFVVCFFFIFPLLSISFLRSTICLQSVWFSYFFLFVVDVRNTTAIVRLKYAESPVYRVFSTFFSCTQSHSTEKVQRTAKPNWPES